MLPPAALIVLFFLALAGVASSAIVSSDVFFFLLAALAPVATSSVVTYDWNVTWVWAAPDGFGRPVVGINGQWPCPSIEATVGDTVVVNLLNFLGNQTTGIHFHGINQIKTAEMDGPSGTTQCSVPPDTAVKYQFTVDAPGTYWYHSHDMGQYPDGFRGPLIVHDPADPFKGLYDEEHIMSITDWYHNDSITLVRGMLTPSNTVFRPPFPDTILVNDGQGFEINVTKGKTYRFRIINYAAIAAAMVNFGNLTMGVITSDASYVKNEAVSQLRIAPAQRHDILVTVGDQDAGNYPVLVGLDMNRDWTNSSGLSWQHNYTGHMVLDLSLPLLAAEPVDQWLPADDAFFKPYNDIAAYSPYDKLITLDFSFCLDQNGYPRSCFNDLTYISQQVPTLYSAATTNDSNTNPVVYGQVNPFIVDYGDTVQIVINNLDAAGHPFHLHGHQFQVLYRAASGFGPWPGDEGLPYAAHPPWRDVVAVMPNSYAVLRFHATNPGVWLFHCHVEWHVEMGLTATVIEAPDRLRDMPFPADHIEACRRMGIPYQGNAAGNTENFTDTSGFITVPPTTYNGALYLPAT
ncbi:multicopper oxidase like protein [Parathielavia hyrcaniae]|uniref:Multicopper oxidase like protein n=1 Tax=Parathielavia hyrcaniae TaxID=113614 RepID=A0AAN6Q8L6_9PEZI|nr:multicopper oxidase like protein [Parathielavia hyrcaniae]